MATRMQQRRGTAEQWTAANPILAAGEIGFETDTNQFKIGDGVNAWSALSYFKNLEDLDVQGFIADSARGAVNGVASLNANGQVPLSQLQELIDNAPSALNTLNEIATVITSVEGSVDTHNGSTTNVHGIANTADLATKTYADTAKSDAQLFATSAIETAVTAHNDDSTNVHGIENTADLATHSYVAGELSTAIQNEVTGRDAAIEVAQNAAEADATTKANAAKTYADGILSTHGSDTTNIHGITDTANLVYTNDARLSDERTPSDYSVTDAKIGTNGLSQSSIVNLTTDLAAKADLVSPELSGTPTAPTATAGTNTTQIATTAFVETAVAALVASAPETLNTLNEIAAAINNDADFATTIVADLATKITQEDLDTASLVNFNAKTSSYTLALSDNTNLVEMDSSSANTITVPSDSAVAFPVGASVDIFQRGTGQTTLVAGSGVTLLYTPGLKLRARYSAATAIKRSANTWIVTGDLTA
jgi:hypothetical protein